MNITLCISDTVIDNGVRDEILNRIVSPVFISNQDGTGRINRFLDEFQDSFTA